MSVESFVEKHRMVIATIASMLAIGGVATYSWWKRRQRGMMVLLYYLKCPRNIPVASESVAKICFCREEASEP